MGKEKLTPFMILTIWKNFFQLCRKWHTKNKFANNEFLKYDTLCIEEREKKNLKMKLIIRILVFSSNDICYILIKHAYLHWTLYHAIFKFVNA